MGLFKQKKLLTISLFLFVNNLHGLISIPPSTTANRESSLTAEKIVEIQNVTKKNPHDNANMDAIKGHILFLFSKKKHKEGLKKYREYRRLNNKHDFALLREISLRIIDDSIKKNTEHDLILALIAIEIANDDYFLNSLGKLLKNPQFSVQAKTLNLLRNFDNDVSDIYLQKALSSTHLMIRLEALSILVQKHNDSAIYQVESLMNKVHPHFKPMFVDFFALAGNPHSISVMKQMLSDPSIDMKLAAILSCKKFSIEELIPYVRKSLTNTSPIIAEASVACIGSFSDKASIKKIENLATSKHSEVKLAALYSLYKLGGTKYKKQLVEMAKGGNNFAITLLSKIPDCKKDLRKIYFSEDNTIRINTAIALLEHGDPLCVPVIKDLILLDKNAFYIESYPSFGRVFSMFKITPLSSISRSEMKDAYKFQTHQIQSALLAKTMDLPKEKFFEVIDVIFDHRRNELVPYAINLIENREREQSKKYLEEKARLPGAPFIRACCQLSLWKSTQDNKYKYGISKWIKKFATREMIQFTQNREKKGKKKAFSTFNLSLEEQSHLLIQAFLSICTKHEKAGLDCIIDSMIDGHKKNRAPLAGVILKTIQ